MLEDALASAKKKTPVKREEFAPEIPSPPTEEPEENAEIYVKIVTPKKAEAAASSEVIPKGKSLRRSDGPEVPERR